MGDFNLTVLRPDGTIDGEYTKRLRERVIPEGDRNPDERKPSQPTYDERPRR